MVVRDFGCPPCNFPCALHGIVEPSCCRDSHAGTVTVASVWLWIVCKDPMTEPSAVTCVRISLAPFLHGLDELSLNGLLICIQSRIHKRFCYSYGHYRIIGKLTLRREELKIPALVTSVKFKSASYNVTEYCTVHKLFLLIRFVA